MNICILLFGYRGNKVMPLTYLDLISLVEKKKIPPTNWPYTVSEPLEKSI
jgi:hypothetical protein